MHLTRLSLDLRSLQARRDVADAYDMHRTLVRAFASDNVSAPARFLWRLETESALKDPVVLVQSTVPANWHSLETLPNYLRKAVETKHIDTRRFLHPEMHYRFRLLANPTVTRNHKRIGLASEEAQRDWLFRQGQRLGFVIKDVTITSSDLLRSRKGSTSISLQRTSYEGVLQVNDVEALDAALHAGIGPGKAFGCGLLSLGPR